MNVQVLWSRSVEYVSIQPCYLVTLLGRSSPIDRDTPLVWKRCGSYLFPECYKQLCDRPRDGDHFAPSYPARTRVDELST